jgi:ubiquinone/menaquinone biosynthesis C-methylase UbiE
MNSNYLTDQEYETYWFELEGMRKAVSKCLRLKVGITILDVGTGWGLFAIEMAKKIKKGRIVGIDITSKDVNMARRLVRDAKVASTVQILRIDATKLSFPDKQFHLATSFLGMRDIYMTRGEKGVKNAVMEMIRVTKPGGRVSLCITPPEDMETEDQRIAVEVEGKVFGAESLPKKFYAEIFRENDVVLREPRAFYTNKKLTVNQAVIELKEGIEIAKKVYGKKTTDFELVWNRYGEKIETFGYGMYSKTVMLVGEKAI